MSARTDFGKSTLYHRPERMEWPPDRRCWRARCPWCGAFLDAPLTLEEVDTWAQIHAGLCREHRRIYVARAAGLASGEQTNHEIRLYRSRPSLEEP